MYHPDTAFIVLTTECNKREVCGHCFYNVEPDRCTGNALDTSAIIGILRKLRLAGARRIIFTGGEPALREDLTDLVSAASGMGMSVMLLTNGLLIDEERAARLEKAKLETAVMSLVTLDEDELDAAAVLSARAGFRLSFIYCLTRENYRHAPDVDRFASDFRTGVLFQPAYIPLGHRLAHTHSLRRLDPFEMSELFMMLRPWARATGLSQYLKLIYDFYTEPGIRPRRCAVAGNTLVIDADGSVYPCFHRRDLHCGSAVGAEFSFALAALQSAYHRTADACCFGEHCISLHTSGI